MQSETHDLDDVADGGRRVSLGVDSLREDAVEELAAAALLAEGEARAIRILLAFPGTPRVLTVSVSCDFGPGAFA